ncbi:MAG: FecR domain-containing protein [Flavobacteriales bacterium]|nr:FecR domain-containing protein [Flavobacteriales bacterium]
MSNSNEHIEDMLYKYLDNECNSEEMQLVTEWLKNDENRIEFEEIKKLQEQVSQANDSEPIEVDVDLAWGNIMDHIATSEVEEATPVMHAVKESTNRLMKYAAILIVGLGVSYYYMNNNNNSNNSVSAVATIEETVEDESVMNAIALMEKEDVKTPDGSDVSIKKGSTLKYPTNFEEGIREVELEGEAFFDVVRDEEKPFLIRVGSATVKVLGTSFLVKEVDNFIEVKVKSGNVMLFGTEDQSNAIEIGKGEHGIYNITDGTLVKTDLTSHNFASWRNNVLRFSGVEMTAAIIDLQDHYNVQIELANNNVASCLFTGQFRDKTIGEVLENIQNNFNIQIKEKNGIIIIDGEGCSN